MNLLQFLLIAATLLSSLVAGLVFTFAIVAMPGIGKLDDRSFLQAFQAMDRVIQNNQPLFVLVWGGSVLALILSCILGLLQLSGAEQWILLGATFLYLFGVQLPTFVVNVPLNNRLQTLDLQELSEPELAEARSTFEATWNRYNNFRTVAAVAVVVLLLVLLLRM